MNDNSIIFPRPGALLVAHPHLDDPNFERTVVLIIAHDESEGTMGVVINRLDPDPMPDADSPLQRWIHSAAAPYSIYMGGPVDPSHFICLQEDITSTSGVTSIDIISDAPHHNFRHRVFRGYAGWAAGQLRHEISLGGWFVVTSAPGDVFDNDSDTLWSRVLERQHGDLRKLAMFPEDPTLN